MSLRTHRAAEPLIGTAEREDEQAPAEPERDTAGDARLALLIATGLAAIGVVGFAVSIGRTTYDIWGAFFVGSVLVLLTLPIALYVSRSDRDSRVAPLLLVVLAAKFAGAVARYAVADVVYEGQADSTAYHLAGSEVAAMFRDGVFSDVGEVTRTRFIELLTGGVYTLTGTTKLGGYLVFAWLSFLGMVLFYRAFRIAWPEGDHRRYRMLLFFTPSVLFWPSSIGKEAWMLLCLGLCSYGIARITAHRHGGLPCTALGVWGVLMVRPHVGLAVMAGAAVAMLFPRRRRSDRPPSVIYKVALVAIVFAGGAIATSQVSRMFGVESLAYDEVAAEVTRRTAGGDSDFTPIDPSTVQGYVTGAGTVLFRPLPLEAHNGVALLASMEGLALIGVLVFSMRRLARVPIRMFRVPYLAYALAFVGAYIFGFGLVSNFGILARQRSLMFPFLWVLVAGRRDDSAKLGDVEPSRFSATT